MDVQPPQLNDFRPLRGVVDQFGEMRLVRYHAFLGEATILLPLGSAFLGGVLLLLGPYLNSKVGAPAATQGLGRLFCFTAAWRLPLAVGLVAGVAAVLAGLRTASMRELFSRSDLLPLAGKLLLFLPLVSGVALLLLSILAPLMSALSTVP